MLLDFFVDNRKSKAINADNQKFLNKRKWALINELDIYFDGLTSWEKLSSLKESYLVQMAKYDIAQCIDHDLTLNLWVKDVLKKRGRINALVRIWQAGYLKWGNKDRTELPKTVDEALVLDKKWNDTRCGCCC